MRTSFFDAGGAFLTDTLKINAISKILADKNILNPFFKEIILNIISKTAPHPPYPIGIALVQF